MSNTPLPDIRIKFLIPLFDSGGVETEDEIFVFVNDELNKRFGGYSQSRVPEEVYCRNPDGRRFYDRHKEIQLICVENLENNIFFQNFKKKLEELTKQKPILMKLTRDVRYSKYNRL